LAHDPRPTRCHRYPNDCKDLLEDLEALATLARLDEFARAAERVNELVAVVDEQAWRHEVLEEDIVRREQVGHRVARERALRSIRRVIVLGL
jgi:hypothetical protein